MKLLANSSYGYQIMSRSQHTMKKNLNNGKMHAAINSELFKELNDVNSALYEVELVEAEIEHKEPIIVGFFNLQNAKIWMLELYSKTFSLNFVM